MNSCTLCSGISTRSSSQLPELTWPATFTVWGFAVKKRNCFDCNEPADHRHHVVPRSKGGRATVPLCASCHAKAHNVDQLRLSEAAWAKRKKAGKVYGSIPYGLRRDKNDNLVADKYEQRVLRVIKRLRKAGKNGREITEEINKRGFRNRVNKPFCLRSVHSRLRSLEQDDDSSSTGGA